MLRRAPSLATLTGDSADVYFARAEEILAKEGIDPIVVMEVFARESGVLCGIDEAKVLLAHALGDGPPDEAVVEALADGDLVRAQGGRAAHPRPLPRASGSTRRPSWA